MIYIYVCVCVCVYINVYIYYDIYIYIYIYVCVCIHKLYIGMNVFHMYFSSQISHTTICIVVLFIKEIYLYCHSHNNWGPRNSFQRLLVPVYFWKTVERPETDPRLLWEWQYMLDIHTMFFKCILVHRFRTGTVRVYMYVFFFVVNKTYRHIYTMFFINYCHSHHNWGLWNGFQRFLVPVLLGNR